MRYFISFILGILFSINGFCQSENLEIIKVPDPDNPGATIDCGPEGSAHDSPNKLAHLAWIGNPQKNRYDRPDQAEVKIYKIEDLIARDADKSKFTPGTPVQVTAYVYDVKPGGVESCNCGTKDQGFKDTHIELTPNSTDTSAEFRLIVEITPRLRTIMQSQGIDWSTATLEEKILNHIVTFQGWLFYDEIHEPQSFSTNPDNPPSPRTGKRPNWRASCWEIHPITAMEIVDEIASEGDNEDANITPLSLNNNSAGGNPIFQPTLVNNSNNPKPINTMDPNSPVNTLILILIGAILGGVGQGIRVIIGLKKIYDVASQTQVVNQNLIAYQQLALSLFIGFAVGAMAGVLAVISNDSIQLSKSVYIAFITAGYAGTDFIEGFMRKNTTPINPPQ